MKPSQDSKQAAMPATPQHRAKYIFLTLDLNWENPANNSKMLLKTGRPER